MTDVFISYSRDDRMMARLIAERLSAVGLKVIFDYSVIVAGEDFSAKISEEIRKATVVLLLLSKNSKRGYALENELTIALEKSNSRYVIPILLDDEAKKNWVWPLVADRQAMEVRSTDDIENVVEEVKKIFAQTDKPIFAQTNSVEARPFVRPAMGGISTAKLAAVVMGCLLVIGGSAILFTTRPPSPTSHGENSPTPSDELTISDFPVVLGERSSSSKLCVSTQFWTAQFSKTVKSVSGRDFCMQAKANRQREFPKREINLLSALVNNENGLSEYKCLFQDRWESESCAGK